MIIDGDGHFFESEEMFEKYMEPALRNYRPRLLKDDQGHNFWVVDGQTPYKRPSIKGAGAPGTAGEAPFQGARAQAALERAYGTLCQRLRGAHQRRGAPYRRCLVAMARLAGGETRSPAVACRHEPLRSLGRGRRQSYYSRCVGAGTSLLRVLARARVAEN